MIPPDLTPQLTELITSFSYLGVFLASVLTASTILIPISGFVIIPVAAQFLDPFLVALIGAFGSALGELVGYGVGRGGRVLLTQEHRSLQVWSERLSRWFTRTNGFLVVIVFAATPLPIDIIAIFAGIIRYDIRKFFLATFIGKFIMFLVLAYGASYILEQTSLIF